MENEEELLVKDVPNRFYMKMINDLFEIWMYAEKELKQYKNVFEMLRRRGKI